ncbi:MAG: hypothetical protein K6F50_02940 [Kiritimatiellae bacterium]|nr:hypothetical protein [Kiritimatiellia bacterium]
MKCVFALVCAFALAGCFTVSESEYPAFETVPAGEASPAIALSGFEVEVTSYVPVYGTSTVWVSEPGWYDRRGRYCAGWTHPETVSSTSYIPRTEISSEYAERAQCAFEEAGWTVGGSSAPVVVDVKFSGPDTTDAARTKEVALMLATLLTVDSTETTWSARLRISDAASGKALLVRNYEQGYSSVAFGFVPLFGPLACEASDFGHVRDWCLSALTDRAVADASRFLAGIDGDLKETKGKKDK